MTEKANVGDSTAAVEFRRGDEVGWWIGDRRATSAEVGAARPRCPNGGRHWFTARGQVGMRKPWCDRCGAPNPNIAEDERREYHACYPNSQPRYVAESEA